MRPDKGARLVRYTADARQVGTRFAWVGIKPTLWRLKTAEVAAEFRCESMEDMKETFGPRWAYNLSGYIMSTRLPEGSYPTLAHLAADMGWFFERGYFNDDQRVEGGGTKRAAGPDPWFIGADAPGDDPERVAFARSRVASSTPI